MELVPALSGGGDKGDTKTASPIPEEIREARSAVVLVWPQLRIGKHVDGHEKESVSQPLISSRQGIVAVIRSESEGAVIPHRGGDSRDADHEQDPRWHDLTLEQLSGDGC